MTMNSPPFSAKGKGFDEIIAAEYEPIPEFDAPVPEVDPAGSLLSDEQVRAFAKSDEGRKLAAWVKEQQARARDLRRPYERQWYTNLAFYAGKQYVEWNKQDDKLQHMSHPNRWMPRLTINKIQPMIRTEQSKLTGSKPSAFVMPASNDDADIFAATAGEQVWESLYARLKFPSKLSRSTFWLSICGTSFMKVFWDAGKYDAATKINGDIEWTPLSPWHILVPDLNEPDLELQTWVMDIQTKPIDVVMALYGDMFPKGIKPTVSHTNDILEAAGVDAGGTSNASRPDSAVISEIWIKPNATPLLPEGGMVTLIDDTIVQAAIHGIPYEHREFPFAKFDHIPTGKFYATSTIEALIPLQREYNRTQSQIVEAKNRSSKPQMMYPEGSVDPTKITSEPGVWIPIRGTAQYPQPVPITELPQYIPNLVDRMKQDFEDISGQHAATRGDMPADAAATAIAYLQEQDDTYLSLTMQSIEQAIEKIARHSLVLAVTYWTTPRLVQATGEDGGFDAMQMKGAEIASSTDIRIEQGSALSMSKSAKQAQVTEWMKFNWIDPNEGFELLDMPMLQQWVNRRKVDKKAAQIENIEFRAMSPQHIEQMNELAQMKEDMGILGPEDIDLETGAPLNTPPVVPVNVWDDHEIHIQIHNLWRKSPSYKFIPKEVKAEVEKHVRTHQLALQMAVQDQAAMDQLNAGGGAMPPMPGMEEPGGQPGTGPEAAPAPEGVDPTQLSPAQGSTEEQLNQPM